MAASEIRGLRMSVLHGKEEPQVIRPRTGGRVKPTSAGRLRAVDSGLPLDCSQGYTSHNIGEVNPLEGIPRSQKFQAFSAGCCVWAVT